MTTTNTAPYEVIAAPFVAYWAPVAEPFPAIDVAPAGNWLRIGTSGELNYGEEGVVIEQPQSIAKWRAGGSTGVRKVFRTEEDFMVRFTLIDLTLEQYRHGLNLNTITTVPAGSGTAGYKKIGLLRGNDVAQMAIILRGPSPYGASMNLQFEIPIAFQTGEPKPVFGKKGEPAGIELEFTAIVDPNASNEKEQYGRIVAQHQVAL
jgi:hypothetical protein